MNRYLLPALGKLSLIGAAVSARIKERSTPRKNTQILLLANCLLLVGAVALLDYKAGREWSMAIFYLIPVATAAWWAGRLAGILFSLASAIAWQYIHVLHTPGVSRAASLWNEVAYLAFFIIIAVLVSHLRTLLRQQDFLTRTDPLTRALKGRVFYEAVHLVLENARRTGRPFTIAFLDLDDFKLVNERRGRAAGDEMLRCVADALQRNLRSTDILSRLGSDEFGLLLNETDDAGALKILARLQLLVSQKTAESGQRLTATIGAATFVSPPDVDEIASQVKAQLTAAKSEGKGRLRHVAVAGMAGAPASVVDERRAAPRFQCNRMARVHRPNDSDNHVEYALVHDLSRDGVSLHAECKFPVGTVLTIESVYAVEAKPLLARVIRSTVQEERWLHGCVLAASLDAGDLRQWLAGSAPQADLLEARSGSRADDSPSIHVLAGN